MGDVLEERLLFCFRLAQLRSHLVHRPGEFVEFYLAEGELFGCEVSAADGRGKGREALDGGGEGAGKVAA